MLPFRPAQRCTSFVQPRKTTSHSDERPKRSSPLAVGILHDAAGAIADRFINRAEGPVVPPAWEEGDGSIGQMVRFSASFFDAFLESQLNNELTTEFSLLCAASYYLADWRGQCRGRRPKVGEHRS